MAATSSTCPNGKDHKGGVCTCTQADKRLREEAAARKAKAKGKKT